MQVDDDSAASRPDHGLIKGTDAKPIKLRNLNEACVIVGIHQNAGAILQNLELLNA